MLGFCEDLDALAVLNDRSVTAPNPPALSVNRDHEPDSIQTRYDGSTKSHRDIRRSPDIVCLLLRIVSGAIITGWKGLWHIRDEPDAGKLPHCDYGT